MGNRLGRIYFVSLSFFFFFLINFHYLKSHCFLHWALHHSCFSCQSVLQDWQPSLFFLSFFLIYLFIFLFYHVPELLLVCNVPFSLKFECFNCLNELKCYADQCSRRCLAAYNCFYQLKILRCIRKPQLCQCYTSLVNIPPKCKLALTFATLA